MFLFLSAARVGKTSCGRCCYSQQSLVSEAWQQAEESKHDLPAEGQHLDSAEVVVSSSTNSVCVLQKVLSFSSVYMITSSVLQLVVQVLWNLSKGLSNYL